MSISSLVTVLFYVPLETLYVTLETIFPANHLTAAKTWSSEPITWQTKLNLMKPKSGSGTFYDIKP